MKLPKLVITDIDGVWTDGGMYYDNEEVELKKFNTSDSAGVLFLKLLNIPVAIITGENTKIVKRRAEKLQIEHLFMGVSDKILVANQLCEKLDVSMNEVAYIGDDINDLELLEAAGTSASPANAPDYIKNIVQIKLDKNGGDGAFREFVERLIMNAHGSMDTVLNLYLSTKDKFRQ